MVRKGMFDTILNGTGGFLGQAWTFKDAEYIRITTGTPLALSQGRQPIVGNWGQFNTWPGEYAGGVDAALLGSGTTYLGQAWFFKGDTYVRYDLASDKVVKPRTQISAGWSFPASFNSGIDVALPGVGSFTGQAWFFRDDEYMRYDLEHDTLLKGPEKIANGWGSGSWPSQFVGGIDTAVYNTSLNVVFMRGAIAIEYDMSNDTIVDGPFWIQDRYPDLVNALYPADIHWGVDSISPANEPAGTFGRLYDFVVHRTGMQPRFWGRYLSNLAAGEVTYLHNLGVRVLPIYNGAGPVSVAGGRASGQQDATNAINQATSAGVPGGVTIYGDIEPGWSPSQDWFLGWWETFAPSQYYDGIYCNPIVGNPFRTAFEGAFDQRPVQTPPLTDDSYLWSQQPQVPNLAGNRGCPTGRIGRSNAWAPALPTRSQNTVGLWQFKINCLPFPGTPDVAAGFTGNGKIDNDLATGFALDRMWSP
jgi:glycoside hydrolase-like protein